MTQFKKDESGAVIEELTFGEKLVGLSFNPSRADSVGAAKQLCAALADLMYANFNYKDQSEFGKLLYDHAIGEILNAQMNVVKVLTFKH